MLVLFIPGLWFATSCCCLALMWHHMEVLHVGHVVFSWHCIHDHVCDVVHVLCGHVHACQGPMPPLW